MAINPQVVLVTGASREIGRGIAIELALLGFSVAINLARSRGAELECKRLCEQAARAGSHDALMVGATCQGCLGRGFGAVRRMDG